MNRILLIGQHDEGIPLNLDGIVLHPDDIRDLDLDEINNLAASGGFYTFVARCKNEEHARETIAAFTERHGPIDILDILDHGAPGGQALGGKALFHVDAEQRDLERGRDFAEWLKGHLQATAQLRLLGCVTGSEDRGRTLLRLLADILREDRVVFGTLHRTRAEMFDRQQGFLLRKEALFSHLAAWDSTAPSHPARIASLISWRQQTQL